MKCQMAPRLILALCALPAAAAVLPAKAQVVQQYEYSPDAIYPIRAALGIATQIELSPNEKILDYSTGFSSGWELTRRDNVFYVKPKNVDVDTNLLVRTATHSYIFELKVVATDWRALDEAKREGAQYRVTFRYPNQTEFAADAVAEDAPEQSVDLRPDRHYNFGYDYATRSGRSASWLVPTAVYDDGRFTYVRMPDLARFPTGNFPAVFGRENEAGDDFVVNTTVENSTIVVHGIYRYLVVRHGKDAIGIRRNQTP